MGSGVVDLVAGTLAGVAQVTVGHPLDTVKVRLQTQPKVGGVLKFNGPLDCLALTVKEEGARGLYKGIWSPLVGIGAVNALLFWSYGSLRRAQCKDETTPLTMKQIMIAGFGAGVVNSFIAGPVDLIKSRLQVQYALSEGVAPTYTGTLDCVKKLVSDYGVRGVFLGIVPTILREGPANAGFYMGYEFTRRTLAKWQKKTPDALGPLSLMFSGSMAGILFWCISMPADVVKSRVQVQTLHMSSTSGALIQPKGAMVAAREILQQEGVRGFYRGLSPAIVRAIPAAAVTFAAYEMSRRTLVQLLELRRTRQMSR